MKDIKEILFEEYSERLELEPPTKLDSTLNDIMGALDDQMCDAMFEAVTDVINEQVRKAYMAGLEAGMSTCGVCGGGLRTAPQQRHA